jgi:hypothetical protein
LDALASEPTCPDPFSPALPKTHPLANTFRPEDTVRPTNRGKIVPGYTSFDPRGRK